MDCLENDGALWVLLPLELNNIDGRMMDNASHLPSIQDEITEMYSPDTYYQDKGRSSALPIAFLAPRNTPRMQSQLSVFTINHRDRTPLEDLSTKNHVWKYTIPQEAKIAIKDQLKLLKFEQFQIYPELESIGNNLRRES
jgi:hypothetical protein